MTTRFFSLEENNIGYEINNQKLIQRSIE